MTRAQGSSDVFVNGIGVSRQGDNNTTHLVTVLLLKCCVQQDQVINGKGCGRVGDVNLH